WFLFILIYHHVLVSEKNGFSVWLIHHEGEKSGNVMTPQFSLSDIEGRWVLISTILASSIAFIQSSALNVALNALQQELQATGIELIWIINGYMLFLASFILLGGSLGDHIGRKRV